ASRAVFFYRHAARRDLHSFPTRRSSDLGVVGGSVPGGGNRRDDRVSELDHVTVGQRDVLELDPGVGRQIRGRAGALGERRQSGRSEEHTSELQSLAYLVCRLLLEKKKKE